jgi:hypothetical protein
MPNPTFALLGPTPLEPNGRTLPFLRGASALGYQQVPLQADCSFAVVSGTRRATLVPRSRAKSLGVPIIVLELGYLNRCKGASSLTGYNQAGWGKIGWVPDFECPSDRLDKLELHIRKERPPYKATVLPNNPAGSILIAGQVGQDAQHNLSSQELCLWLARRYKQLIAEDKSLATAPVVFRPHPNQDKTKLTDAIRHQRQLPSSVPINDALDNARLLLTYNSTLGIDAMLRGVPVVSHPCAHYHKYAVEDLETRMRYLRRLSYAQWNLQEFESGEALEFLLKHRPEP